MIVTLAYGRAGLEVEIPNEWDVSVIEPAFVPGLPDPESALCQALQSPTGAPPLARLAGASDRIGVVFSDITRPAPNHLLIPAVLDSLKHVPRENIILFNALGTHRANTDKELRAMLGDAVVDRYVIRQNDASHPSTQVHLGLTSQGHEVWLNQELVDCDLKVLTGFIEPHFFAGFSGGGKAVMPGMAGLRTVLGNHDAGMIGCPSATWGTTWGNPIWEEAREVALGIGSVFLLNVTLNRNKEVTGVYAGDLDTAHAAGCAAVRNTAMVPVADPFDIVITSNSGYPLDLNLYQAVKGMSAAAQVVRDGGSIIVAAECWDGIPDHGRYGQLLREADGPQALLDRITAPGFLMQDQWEAQVQAQIQLRADVHVYSDHLTSEQIEMALLKPCLCVEDTLAQLRGLYGPRARICILPEGPQTIPYLPH
jgi:nickel-dependent lactate racemase